MTGMEFLLVLIITAFALLGFAGYRVSKHRGDTPAHELMHKPGRGSGGGGGFAGG